MNKLQFPKKSIKKVAILGTTSSWRDAPFEDKTWEVWGMNAFWNTWGKYATRWFEIHQMSILLIDGWKDYSWLTKCPIPIYMAQHYAQIPNSVPFPLDAVSKGYFREFSSTFCYELALAIHEGFEIIGLYGVDFSEGSLRERFVEWRGVLYWLGIAIGKGIQIQFPENGAKKLFNNYLYGIEYWNEVRDVRKQIFNPIKSIINNNIDGVNGMLIREMRRKEIN